MFPFDILFSQKQPVICPYCFKIIKDKKRADVCPYCGKSFPAQYTQWRSPFIAIVGAATSGKSHYIATLIQQIYAHHLRYNWSLSAADDDTSKEYNEKFKIPLYDDIQIIHKTAQRQRNVPLLYYMRTPTNHYITLAFFDTAGEHFYVQTVMEDYTPYVCNATGIILLLDPLQQRGLRDKLPESRCKILPMLDVRDGGAKDMTERLYRVIMKGKRLSLNKKIPIPLAVAFSKMDEFRDVNDIKESPVYRPSSANRHFNIAEFNDIHESISGWVNESIPGFVGVTEFFNNVGFFGISALGEPPREGKLYSRPRPMRVEDPFLWLLWKNHFIKGK